MKLSEKYFNAVVRKIDTSFSAKEAVKQVQLYGKLCHLEGRLYDCDNDDIVRLIFKLINKIATENSINLCAISVGDVVKTIHDVFEADNTPIGSKNLGMETYTVTKIEYWAQGNGFLIYGDKSDKRTCNVWNQEADVELVLKNMK